jgi:hypothetical protein
MEMNVRAIPTWQRTKLAARVDMEMLTKVIEHLGGSTATGKVEATGRGTV